MHFDTLESRRLFAASPVIVGTELQVFGDKNSNTIVVNNSNPNTIRVTVGARSIDFNAALVSSIRANVTPGSLNAGTPGNDRVTINVVGKPAIVFGGSGNDTLTGGNSSDTIRGESGNDQIFGAAGNDNLDGGAGDDQLFGQADNDTLMAGAGADKLFGDAGIDRLIGHSAEDIFDSGAGVDTLDVTLDFGKFLQHRGRSLGGTTPASVGGDQLELKADAGSFGGALLVPVLQNVQSVTRSLQPIVDAYDTQVPIVNQTLGSLLDTDGKFRGLVNAVGAINSIRLDALSGTIGLGTFTIAANGNQVTNSVSGNPFGTTNLGRALDRLNAAGVRFPVLQNSGTVANAVLNLPNVDLVTLQLPSVNVSIRNISTPPVTVFLGPVPVSVSAFGSASFRFGGSLGFDLTGLRTGRLLDGFYVSSNTGASLSLGIGAQASLNAFVGEVGVRGSVTGTIGVTLRDTDADGKVRINEFGSGFNVSAGIAYDVTLFGRFLTFEASASVARGTFAL